MPHLRLLAGPVADSTRRGGSAGKEGSGSVRCEGTERRTSPRGRYGARGLRRNESCTPS